MYLNAERFTGELGQHLQGFASLPLTHQLWVFFSSHICNLHFVSYSDTLLR